ncbi:LGFP repeat-containing protein [Rhodococcus sp. O3]|uniref:LGFP repeat-containing protein n=1 Tax=Rhodococcus sp. O3 TaxID=3404919 RepID=UPI003B676F8E
MKWTPTENPNSTIVPGKMRSDRQELPEGFTKEDADKAEILEAKILAASRSRTARSASATNVLAAAAPTDCITYFPAWQYQVCGEIRVKYDSLGNVNSFLLWPTSGNITNPDGVGQRVTFVNGPIYWHPNRRAPGRQPLHDEVGRAVLGGRLSGLSHHR